MTVPDPLPFWPSVANDVAAHGDSASHPASRWGWLALGARVALRSPGFRVVLLYRLGHSARTHWGAVGRVISGALFWFVRHWYGCSIASTARLGGGLMLPHPQGIVIGGLVDVGPGTWVYQNVTLGGSYGKPGMPRIGARAVIYTGAVVAGPVSVGDDVAIGANTVVTRDIPSGTRVGPPEVVLMPGLRKPGKTPESASNGIGSVS